MHDTLRITRGHSRGAGDGEDVAHPPVPHALLHVRGPKAPDAANMTEAPGKVTAADLDSTKLGSRTALHHGGTRRRRRRSHTGC